MIKIQVNKKLLRLSILLLPIPLILLFLLAKHLDFLFYRKLMAEDSIIEYMTSLFYFMSFGIAIFIYRSFMKLKNKLLGILYFLLMIVMFFAFAEEISWGQRLMNLESPKYFMEHSQQKEINIHNLYPIQNILHRIYIIVGLLGSFLWTISFILDKYDPALNRYTIPQWYLMSYFLPVSIFYFYYDYIMGFNNFLNFTHREQEPAEFFLSIGCFLFVLISRCRQIEEFNLPHSKNFNIEIESSAIISSP